MKAEHDSQIKTARWKKAKKSSMYENNNLSEYLNSKITRYRDGKLDENNKPTTK